MKNPQLSLLLPALFLVASGAANAQGPDDPPSRVARIAYVTGPVSFEPGSVDQWTDASPNYPMTTGDSLYSDAGGRAVLRIGQNSIRLNSLTNFQFVNLADDLVQASINSGSLGLHVRHLFDGESWEVDTPNGAITVLRVGDYRIDTDPDSDFTTVTVRSGDVEITANNQSFPVHAGQTAYFDDSGNSPDISGAGPQDDFDAFFVARNRVEDVPPPQYVSPNMVGYEDLAANGEWTNTADGAVWTPRVAVGWTPYHDGHWAWVAPWGWTWVDDAPWGFAPFHYGRWAMVNNRWGWYPGAVAPRPYYAPALVAFVGGGGFGVGISVGGGGGGLVGWFPLGPKEVYYPTYQVSPTYVRQVNVTNTRITTINVTNINVTNITYVNRTAVVAVPQNSFVSAQPVKAAAVRMTSAQIQQGQVIGAAPKVAPQPQSVIGPSSAHRAAAPPAAVASRVVVAKRTPPPAPVAFAAQQKALQAHPGAPVAKTELTTLRAQAPAPARVQVKPIDTKQVHAITPVVKTTAAPPLAQRAAQAKAAPKPAAAQAQRPAAVPAAAIKAPVAAAPAKPAVEAARPAAPKAPAVEAARPVAAPKAAEPKAAAAAKPAEPKAAEPRAEPKAAAAPKAAEPKAAAAAKPAEPKAAEPRAEPKAAEPKAAAPKAAAPKTKREDKKTEEEKKKE